MPGTQLVYTLKSICEKIGVEKNKDGKNEMKLRIMILYKLHTAGFYALASIKSNMFSRHFFDYAAAHLYRMG